MRVRVLYFGVLRELFGRAEELAEVPDGTTVGELPRILRSRTSNMATTEAGAEERLWQSLAVAVNREYSSAQVRLQDGDEVALLPPVSGGLLCAGREARFASKDS